MTIRSSGNAVRFSWVLLAVISVLAFSALDAGAASAKALVLEVEGTAAPAPSNAYVEIGLTTGKGPCLFGTYKATLASNSMSKDLITNSSAVEINPDGPCTGVSISGEIREAVIASNGKTKVTANPALAITTGGCTYEVGKLAATFTVPSGQAFAPLTIRAKRSKASAKSCAKTEIYEAGLAIGGWRKDGSPQDYELEDI
jgi:hypothetical protein